MESNGRDINGYFAAGNKIGRGNAGNRRLAELRRVLHEAATDEDIREIYRAMLAAAKGGDVAAAKLLFEHLVGRPVQALELSSADGRGIDLAAVASVMLEVIGDDDATRLRLAAAFARLGRIGGGSEVDGEPGPHP